MTEQDFVAEYTKLLNESFQTTMEVTKGWPVAFHFPPPQNEAEQAALRQFIAETETRMGKAMRWHLIPQEIDPFFMR